MHEAVGQFFGDLLQAESISILDLGAQCDGDLPIYSPITSHMPCEVLGIDVSESMAQEFVSQFRPPSIAEFRSAFLGNGEEHFFYSCHRDTTSSLLMPNYLECEKYDGLSEPVAVTNRQLICTIRLDEIAAGRTFHLIKSDLQGADLDVLSSGISVLSHSLMVLIEVEFIPQYADGPRFCEVLRFMEANGFVFHSFHDFGTRPLAGFDPGWPKQSRGFKQWLWANAAFVRRADSWEDHSNEMIASLAVLTHLQLKAFDYTWALLSVMDVRNGTKRAQTYVELLSLL